MGSADMKGWLVVNEFVNSEKFRELFRMLEVAADKEGIALKKLSNARVWTYLGDNAYVIRDEDRPDFVLFWDKDIKLAYELERCGIRLFNSASAIADCDDKSITYLKLCRAGIKEPLTFVSPKKFHADGLLPEDFLKNAAEKLGFPCVVKECLGSFGAQVYLAEDMEKLKDTVRNIGDRPYIIQEFISESYGRDVRLQVVGEKVVAGMKRFNDKDFRANVTNGGSMEKYTPDAAMSEMAVKVCRILELDFAGVDILFGNEGPVLCEVNSNAHFKNLYDCTGINTADHIMSHIRNCICN